MAVRMSAKNAEKAEQMARLRDWIKPGDTVYTVLRDVSRSGMSRTISLVIIKDGEALHPNYAAATVLDRRVKSGFNDGIVCQGGGMDMGFELVYNLSRVLYPEYQCTGETKCKSSDHQYDSRTKSRGPYSSDQGAPVVITHKDGYALSQRWL